MEGIENAADVGMPTATTLSVQPDAKRQRLNSGGKPVEVERDRRSSGGYVRAIPKKGGAGGKGVWGKPGDEMRGAVSSVDRDDPNYDPDTEPYDLEEITTGDDVDKALREGIAEYFVTGLAREVGELISDLNTDFAAAKAVALTVAMAMERKDSERELASNLIADLAANRFVAVNDIEKAFDELLDAVEDARLDTPDASTLLGRFLARAVADDCIPPSFLAVRLASAAGTLSAIAMEALRSADVMLSMKHGLVRLDTIWGAGGGRRPVRQLKKRIIMLIREYIDSDDIAEAERCVRELEVPHFHHEIVFEAFSLALESGGDGNFPAIVRLLRSLADSVLITPEQMKMGIDRVIAQIDDICLDVPNAHKLLAGFAKVSVDAGIFPASVLASLPQRGRKRFISEGDGGRIKE